MAWHNSPIKIVIDWAKDNYITKPVHYYEPTEDGQYRSLADPNKVTTQMGAMRDIAHGERAKVSDIQKHFDRYVLDAPVQKQKPEPEQSQEKQLLLPEPPEPPVSHSGRLSPGEEGKVVRSWDRPQYLEVGQSEQNTPAQWS